MPGISVDRAAITAVNLACIGPAGYSIPFFGFPSVRESAAMVTHTPRNTQTPATVLRSDQVQRFILTPQNFSRCPQQ